MKIGACVCFATMLATSLSFAQDAPQNLGASGESCRARSDCKVGLRCVNQVCTDEHDGQACGATSDCGGGGGELRCIQNKCTNPSAATHSSAPSGSASSDDWMKFNPLDGNLHAWAGITLAAGFDTGGATGNFSGLFKNFSTFDGAFMFALAGGAYIGNHQLSVEVAPVTFVFDGKANGPVFQATANYAYMVPLTDSGDLHVYWPIRFGAGILAGPDVNALGFAYFVIRADLIGAAVQIGHVVIDFHLPSFQWAITDKSGTQVHLLDWLFGMTIGYAF